MASKKAKQAPKTAKQARIEEAKERRQKANRASGATDDDALYVFRHPLRVHMVTSLNEEGEGSAQDLADRLGAKTGTVDYHLKVLVIYQFVEYVRTERSGNREKHIYRAIRRAELSMEEWEQLPLPAKSSWMHLAYKTIVEEAKRGLTMGSFERWPESPVLCINSLWVDRKAFHEINGVFEDAWEKSLAIAADASGRLPAVEKDGDEILRLSLHAACFPVQVRKQEPLGENGKGGDGR